MKYKERYVHWGILKVGIKIKTDWGGSFVVVEMIDEGEGTRIKLLDLNPKLSDKKIGKRDKFEYILNDDTSLWTNWIFDGYSEDLKTLKVLYGKGD